MYVELKDRFYLFSITWNGLLGSLRKLIRWYTQILSRDKEAQEKAPQVLKEDTSTPKSQYTKTPGSSRSFSTMSQRRMPELEDSAAAGSSADAFAASGLGGSSQSSNSPPSESEVHPSGIDMSVLQSMRSVAEKDAGTKFGIPETKMERTDHFRYRYNPVVDLLTKTMMRSGQLAKAQKVRSTSRRIT